MIKFLMVLLLLVTTMYSIIVGRAHAQDAAIGDSIALGTGRALGVPTYAEVGASSCWVLRHAPRRAYRHIVVSAGINDAPGSCVRALFASIVAARVVVILPAPINSARANVARWAASHGYATISYVCRGGCSKSNFHPASYAVVAAGVRRLWER